jgi:hypothetical protein
MLTLTKEKCFGRPGQGRILTRGYIRQSSNCRVLLWAEKLGAGLWAGLLRLSCDCQLELEVTITDVVNLWQSPGPSVSNRERGRERL